MSKKILAVALAAAMILGLASVASAAFIDTDGHAREAAIQRLYGLGLIDGFGDGTFRPEESITRAQIAKMIVYALGLKDAADMLSGVPVGFSDVAANHWASGYINIASSQGIVQGYPDGTFKPEQNVTYAEILTMILRALGYGPVLSHLPWPAGYITKAAELKINKGINFLSNTFATRGDVCGLLANALTVPKLIQVGYGDTAQYVVSGTSGTTAVFLLTDMGATYEDGYLVSAPDLFANNGTTIQLDGAAAKNLADGYTVSGLLGHYVRTWINEDGKVFYVEDITPATQVKTAKNVVDSDTVTLPDNTPADVPTNGLFRNYARVIGAPNLASGESVTLILDAAGAIKFAVVNTYTWGVVDSVNLNYGRINFSDTNGSSSITLKDYDIIWEGAASSLDELTKKDVVEYIRSTSDKKAVLIVTRNPVQGEFTKLAGTTATVDGTDYTAITGAVGVDIGKLGGNVEILLNKAGKIVKMTALTTPAPSGTTAIVLAKGTGFDGFTTVQKLKLWLTDGSETVLDLAATLTFPGATDSNADGKIQDTEAIASLGLGDVITYKTNSSGKINNVTLDVSWKPTGSLDIDDDLSLVKFGGTRYKVTADTLILNLKTKNGGADFDKAAVLTVKEFLDLPASGEVGAVVFTGTFADLIVVVDASTPVSDTIYGMVYGSYQAKIGSSVQNVLRILVNGTTPVDYPAGSASYSKEAVVAFKVADGEISTIGLLKDESGITYTAGDVASDTYDWRVTDIDLVNNVLTLKQIDAEGTVKPSSTTKYLWLSDDTLYFDATASNPQWISGNDVAKDSIVDVYVDNNGVVVVLVVVGD
ncbi:MAG TPA: S-layer homology domain-containing protein [Firmicutes bacterium]|nr:S-layer homology domain-containing protein [Candidatus Fermentithermobacillaceae bacterium]